MLTVALVVAGLAALLHVYIFWLESLVFTTKGRAVFGASAEDVEVMRPWALNQGFYNLFLAVVTGVGIALTGTNRDASVALVLAGVGSMLAAAAVLITSDRTKARAAAVQGTFPAISLVLLALWGWA